MTDLIDILRKEGVKKRGSPNLLEEIRRSRANPSYNTPVQQVVISGNPSVPPSIPVTRVEIVPPDPVNTGMKKAYDYATYMMKIKMGKEDPTKLNAIVQIREGDIAVVPGQYDKVEEVFQSGKTPFTMYDKWGVPNKGLNPKQIVFVNCPGNLGDKGIETLAGFVSRGGYLVTTDWALKNVIKRAFPKKIMHNGVTTKNDVVPVSIVDPYNKYTLGVAENGSKPVWWLETASYPIEILDNKGVITLLTSQELGKRYGQSPVAVEFQHGKGKVFHFISHFYLQKTGKKSNNNSVAFMNQNLGLTNQEVGSVIKDVQDVSFAEAESAYSSARLIYNIILDKLSYNKGLK